MNLPLTFGATSGEVIHVPESEMRAATDFRSALALCIRLSRVRRTHNDLACLAGINPSLFSRIINGDKNKPYSAANLATDKIPVIEKLCGNTAMTQWLAMQHGATIHIKTTEEKLADCQAELAAFKAKEAA